MSNLHRTLKLWQGAFARETDCPRYKLSWRILYAGFGAALLYTVMLTLSRPDWTADWVHVSQPLTNLAGSIIPSVSGVSIELIERGHPDRAGYAANVLAFQWLASGIGWLLATPLLIMERDRLSRACAAARAATSGQIPRHTFMNFYLPLAFAIGFFVWWPFNSHSFNEGRGHYDLAFGSLGLYLPFLACTVFWWFGLFVVAMEVIGKFGKRPAFESKETI
jgi:hypothetical protein